MLTIDQEVKKRIRHPLDLDNMADRYKTANGHFSFTSPSMWVIEKHLFYLLRNSVEKEFETKYKMRPDYLSYDEYGTIILEPLLMFVNNVLCVEDFDLVKVIVPTLQSIVDISRDKFPKKEPNELFEVNW